MHGPCLTVSCLLSNLSFSPSFSFPLSPNESFWFVCKITWLQKSEPAKYKQIKRCISGALFSNKNTSSPNDQMPSANRRAQFHEVTVYFMVRTVENVFPCFRCLQCIRTL